MAHIVENVERLEHSAHASAHNQQPPLTVNLHQEVATSRLNSSNKKITALPTAIPSVSSQYVPQNLNTSPPFSMEYLLPSSQRQVEAGTGSEPPVVSHTTDTATMMAKCETPFVSAPMTTAYPTGLCIPIPLTRAGPEDNILQFSFRSEVDWRRHAILEAVLSSTFVANNTLEPVIGESAETAADNADAGDDGGTSWITAAEGSSMNARSVISMITNADGTMPSWLGLGSILGSPGKSIYTVFLEQIAKSEWRCLFGDEEHPCPSRVRPFRRLEGALVHVRTHLNHRPFKCKGECLRGGEILPCSVLCV